MKSRHRLILFRLGSVRRRRDAILTGLIILLGCACATTRAQNLPAAIASVPSTHFRIGEKLTYYVSFGKFENAGYAETYVVSRGKIGSNDVVELRSKVKTLEFVSAAFFLIDESRIVYASAESGLPLYITRTVNDGPLPRETVGNYLSVPTSNFDLLTLIYKARESGGVGTFPLFENDQLSYVTFGGGVNEKLKTGAGEFDTNMSTVQSEYLLGKGISDLKINFTADENRIPVLIRFKTGKGEFRAVLSAIQMIEPEAPAIPVPTPAQTLRPPVTPKPTPSPEPYAENKPLAPELGFALGESLDYNVSTGGRHVAVITLKAVERKLFQREDSLLLTATVTGAEPGNRMFSVGDSIRVQVNAETLAPRHSDTRFVGALSSLTQTVEFNQKSGMITFGGALPIDGPIGTHTILSLIYAMRSFNLKPSKDPSNPVNDTRVAVFWGDRPFVFTLRPSNAEPLLLNGDVVSAQLVTVNTGNPQLDALNIKVWLANDGPRFPIRFAVGGFQADLAPPPNILSK